MVKLYGHGLKHHDYVASGGCSGMSWLKTPWVQTKDLYRSKLITSKR